MKIIFFGLGSIGKRHASILLKNYQHDLYAFRSDKKLKGNEFGIKELFNLKEVKKLRPDIAFITNPTSEHIKTAISCAEIGCKLFIEKPIGRNLKDLDKLIGLIKKNNLVSYIGYNLRFHPIIKSLKKYTNKKKVLHVRVVCTSFLPNWRPNTNYLNSYSAKDNLGGGAILDLSHEIDYVSYLFGEVKNIQGNFSRRSSVTVDAEDFADLLVSSKSVPINIHINFLSHLKQRYIQIDFENLTVIGDLINCEIKEFQNEKLKKAYKLDYEKDQEYIEQIKYFFDNINNPKMMNNLLEASNLYKQIISFKEKK